MDYEMDATQALPMDEDEDYEDDQPPPNKVVGQLKVLACKGFPETVFDLQEGENVIGRHEANKIAIPLKSLSKQHACIEVHGNSHLIYDMDSRNKTRRGKLFLKPNIRYELKNCDILTLADVTCQYLLPEDDGNMSDSSDSVDLLQPTQALPVVDNAKETQQLTNVVELKTPRNEVPKSIFAEDSDENSPSAGGKTPGDHSIIPDTQPARRTSETVVQESDSDTDMEDNATNNNEKAVDETDLDVTGLANASTQDVNGADLETQAEPDPADMATQAYQANTDEDGDSDDDGDKEAKKFDAADAATLAYEPEVPADDKKDFADEATLAYDTEEEVKDDDKQASDSALQATQAFVAPSPVGKEEEAMDTDDSMAEEQTQSFTTAQPVMNSTQNDDIQENDLATAATQAVADQSTVAYNTDDEMAPTQAYVGVDVADQSTVAYKTDGEMAPTQAYGGGDDAMAATQAYGGDDAMAPTQAYGGDDAMAATQAYGGDDAMAATQAYGGGDEDAEAPTLAYGGDDAMAATQAYGGDDAMAPTQAYGGGDDAEAPTLAYGNEEEEEEEDAAVAPTQACGPDDPLAPTQKYVPDDSMAATQAYGGDDAEAPTLAYGGDDAMDDADAPDDAMAATQAYTTDGTDNEGTPKKRNPNSKESEDNEAEDSGNDADEPTQAYGLDDADAPTQAFITDDDNEDDDMVPTQAYGAGDDTVDGDNQDQDDADAPTLAYGNDEVAEEEDVKKSGGGEESSKEPVDDSEEPTQAYGLGEEEASGMDDNDEPTQAYGLDAEAETKPQMNDEEEPTQAYGDVQGDDTEDNTEEIVTKQTDVVADEEDGETQIPDSEGEEDDGDNATPRTRRIESLLAQVPVKSAMTSPNRDDKPKKVLHVAFMEQTPESEDSEEILAPTKRSTRGRKGKPAKKEEDKDEKKKPAADKDDKDEEKKPAADEDDKDEEKKPAADEDDKDEEKPATDEDDIDVAPTRQKSLRHKKKTKDSEDGGSTSRDTRGKGKASKEEQATDKDVGKKSSKAKGKKGKTKKAAAGSKKIDEFFPQANVESNKDSDDTSNASLKNLNSRKVTQAAEPKKLCPNREAEKTSPRKLSPRRETEKLSPKKLSPRREPEKTSQRKLSPRRETEKPSPRNLSPRRETEKPSPKKLSPRREKGKPTSKKVGRKSSRRKGDDTDADDTESLPSTFDSVKDVTEVDCGSSRGTRRSGRETPTQVEESVKQKTRTSGRKGKKGSETSSAKEKKVDSENIDLSPITKTVEIRVPKMDFSSDSDSCAADKLKKTVGARKSGRKSVASSKVDIEEDDLSKSESKPQRSSRRGKQNDEPNKDVSEKVGSTPTTRATRGKKGAKIEIKESKVDQTEDSVNKASESRPSRGRKRGAKDEVDAKEEEEDESVKEATATPSRTSGRGKKAEEKVNTEKVTLTISESKRTRKASRKADEEVKDEKEQESDKKSARSSRSNAKGSEKTLDDNISTGKRGRQTLEQSTPSAESPTTGARSSGRQTRTPARFEDAKPKAGDDFKKPGPVKKGGRGKSAAGDACEESDEGTPSKGRNSRKGKSEEQPLTPKTATERRGKRSLPTNQSPSSSPSSTPSPSPAKRGRLAENDTTEVHSPSLRRRISGSKPKVMFTGVTDKEWDKIVTSLGGILVDSVYDCTHLITDKVRRTVKFLCCLSKGALIINPKWLDMCKASKTFVDPMPFLLKDRPAEKQHQFTMVTSYQKASSEQVLKGKKIHVTPGVKPEPQQMKDIIKCAGGEFVSKLSNKPDADTVIVSCEQDLSSVISAANAGIPIVSAEFILTGMLRQEANPEHYQLEVGTSTTKRRASTQPTHGGKRKR